MASLTKCIDMMDEGIERTIRLIPQLPVAEAKLSRLMLMVSGSLNDELEFELKPHKLNHSEFLTLMFLNSRPESSSTPGELCEFTKQGATNMTRIGNALVKRGLITRGGSDDDRRRVVIRITAAGKRMIMKMLPPLFPRLDAMFVGFSDVDKRNLSRLLRKLAHNLDQADSDIQA
jgi:MarR family transcriptional regulator, negative regulator of the multidrug operon emrRAB